MKTMATIVLDAEEQRTLAVARSLLDELSFRLSNFGAKAYISTESGKADVNTIDMLSSWLDSLNQNDSYKVYE